jgi:hypothetical protein
MALGKKTGGRVAGTPNKAFPFRAALDRAIAQDDAKRIRKAAETLLDRAAAGEPWALGMLADRLDGKPVQPVAGADDHPAIQQAIEVRIVDPAG